MRLGCGCVALSSGVPLGSDACLQPRPLRKAQEPPKSHRRPLRTAQDAAKEASRGLRERFWNDFGTILDPPRPRKTSKSVVLSALFVLFAIFQGRRKKRPRKAPTRGPREAKMGPRSGQGGPRTPPRGPKTAPEAARSAPRAAQEAPQRSKEGLPYRLGSWGGLREASGANFGASLGPPGNIFEPSLERFSSQFQARRRPTGCRKDCSKSLFKRSSEPAAGQMYRGHAPQTVVVERRRSNSQ